MKPATTQPLDEFAFHIAKFCADPRCRMDALRDALSALQETLADDYNSTALYYLLERTIEDIGASLAESATLGRPLTTQ